MCTKHFENMYSSAQQPKNVTTPKMAIYNSALYSNIEEKPYDKLSYEFIHSVVQDVDCCFLKDCSGVAFNSEAENACFSALIHLFKG